MASVIETAARAVAATKTVGTLHEALERLTEAVSSADNPEEAESNEKYRAAANERWGSDGSIEIDGDAIVSASEDGAYVQAWVWVDADEDENEVDASCEASAVDASG